jgi:dipeptidyl aminopeptidase/acylaminoacyl peptidase
MSILAVALVLAVHQAGPSEVLVPPRGEAAPPARRAITETDLFRFVWVGDPQISPDGADVAFVRVAVNKKKDGYETALWIVPADGSMTPRPFTTGPRDTAPRWSPDGRRLAFLRSAEKDGKPQPAQIHLMERAGGEARAITDLAKGASAPVWSPDGRTLAFTSATNAKDLEAKARDARPEGDAERESDVRVITRAIYRWNNGGYVDFTRPSHVWTIAVPTGSETAAPPRQVTSGAFEEEDPVWSADGARILFTSTRVAEPYYEASDEDLFAVAADGGAPALVTSIDGAIAAASPSPDGRRIAFRGTLNGKPLRSYIQPDLFVVDVAGAPPRNLSAGLDFDVLTGLAGDQRAPRGGGRSPIVWPKDGRSLLFVAAERGRANVKRLDLASGRLYDVTAGDQEVMSFSASADGSRIVALISTATEIGDLFVVDVNGPRTTALRRLTSVNAELFGELDLPPPEEIWYPSFDGTPIHALVQKPPGFDASKRYPLILNIHGGPHAAYGYTFFHEMQWMAARGYVVLYPNPRGSSTYGQDFGNVIQFRYPGDDHKDLMAGVDELIRRGYVDPNRLGITGGSGGGVLTNWAITQTDRFAAAVSQRSIADWGGFWYTSDFTLFNPTWFRAAPWQDPADYAARSAITHVEKVRTPLMLIEGEADYRTPPGEGGEQMFRALKFLRRPTVMVRFPDESHELSRSGKPWHRVERLQHIVAWFDKYLQGKPAPYDVPP